MRPHDLPLRETPAIGDFLTIILRARRMQARAMGNAIASVLRVAGSVMSRGKTAEEHRESARWILPKAPMVLPPSSGQTIRCDVGTVWITQGDTSDYVLRAGESLALRPADKVIVSAMAKPALVHRTADHAFHHLHQQQKEHAMNELTLRDRELVALGAAMGSNCAPCIEVHIPKARESGLSDEQIAAAIQIADEVRRVPARNVLNVALGLLPKALNRAQAEPGSDNCTGVSTMTQSPCCA